MPPRQPGKAQVQPFRSHEDLKKTYDTPNQNQKLMFLNKMMPFFSTLTQYCHYQQGWNSASAVAAGLQYYLCRHDWSVEGGRIFFFQLYEIVSSMIGRFPRVLHWEGTFLHGCYSHCYFFPVVNRLPLSSSLMESSYRSSTEEWIHIACLNIWLDLICWSAWEPLSHFPSDPEEHHVANGDATSLTAIHCSGSSPEKHSNHGWPREISYSGHLTWLQ